MEGALNRSSFKTESYQLFFRVTVIKKTFSVFVEKSTFPEIHQYDEIVEINNVYADILGDALNTLTTSAYCSL